MRILLAPDKFKDALPAEQVVKAIKEGIHFFNPDIEAISLPMADGGEGTAQILTHYYQGAFHEATVHDPLMRKIKASYGLSPDKKIAFIEMATASGLELLKPAERNCYFTSSYGTGELIKAAIQAGAEQIILGIGGSATCDGGIGMAAALGYEFTDKEGNKLKPTGENLSSIYQIDDQHVDSRISEIEILVACDVDNLLTGPSGAAQTYAPQKGADNEQVESLDEGLGHLSKLITAKYNLDIANIPGSGAAGGLGGGAKAFLVSSLRTGTDLILELLQVW